MSTEPERTPMQVIILAAAIAMRIAILFVGAPALSQTAMASPPANSHPLQYRTGGWDCNRGFVKTGDACVAMKIPPNAYLSSGGSRWDCDRGFMKRSEECVRVSVPANAYFDESSYRDGWACNRGYRRIEKACVAVSVPPNAY